MYKINASTHFRNERFMLDEMVQTFQNLLYFCKIETHINKNSPPYSALSQKRTK